MLLSWCKILQEQERQKPHLDPSGCRLKKKEMEKKMEIAKRKRIGNLSGKKMKFPIEIWELQRRFMMTFENCQAKRKPRSEWKKEDISFLLRLEFHFFNEDFSCSNLKHSLIKSTSAFICPVRLIFAKGYFSTGNIWGLECTVRSGFIWSLFYGNVRLLVIILLCLKVVVLRHSSAKRNMLVVHGSPSMPKKLHLWNAKCGAVIKSDISDPYRLLTCIFCWVDFRVPQKKTTKLDPAKDFKTHGFEQNRARSELIPSENIYAQLKTPLFDRGDW